MLAEVQQLAFDLHPGYLPTDRVEFNHCFGAFTTDMHHSGVRVIHHLPASLLDSHAVIHFLVVEKITRIEQTDLIDHLSTDQVIATR